ncbi:MAG TPA: PepSY-associated TM helix domain-containing protein, partial [Xanthomonadales bacterium]|nr:PepSY-associated TM helix domain-containing protein [Xanthomonadales bacterium]
MKFRPILFWAHLSCGVLAGVVILMMSVTGVLLTYERQIINWADQQSLPAIIARGERASVESILAAARAHVPGTEPTAVTMTSEQDAAVAVAMGRGHTVYVDPYSARVLGEGAQGVHGFFSWITQMHRWFAASDESRDTARAITGASNLIFLFIVLSGMYLWLPMIWRKTQFRMRLWFSKKPKSSKARDFNWHHVFGIWMCLPLVFIIASATVFSYGWANALVYKAFGEEPP